jgi:hypothetical protein
MDREQLVSEAEAGRLYREQQAQEIVRAVRLVRVDSQNGTTDKGGTK